MTTKLTKRTRTTADDNGCEFDYACYTNHDGHWEGDRWVPEITRTYISATGLKTKTLKELRKAMAGS